MGTVHPFPAHLIVVGVLRNRSFIDFQTVVQAVTLLIGPAIAVSDPFEYTHSDYYAAEMGMPLIKQWIAIQSTTRSEFYYLKHLSQQIENKYLHNGSRIVNIDPGVLFSHNFILLSTKNYSHRLPLGDGIYGELELMYQHNQWVPMPWTYPDYKTQTFLSWLFNLRKKII